MRGMVAGSRSQAVLTREWLRRIGAEGWAEKVADSNGVTLDAVLRPGRSQSVVRARHELRAVLRDTFAFSLSELAEAFGVDHATISNSCQWWARRRGGLFFLAENTERAAGAEKPRALRGRT